MSENGWHRVDPADVPAEGRVRSAIVDGRGVALSRCGARLGALENRCPHQGGPLGEGADREGLAALPVARLRLRPGVGPAAGGVRRRRADLPGAGACGRRLRPAARAARPGPHGRRRGGRDAGGLGCAGRVRHGRALQPRPRGGVAACRGAGRADLRRHPARGRRVVRRERVRQAHRPARGVPGDRGAGLDEPADRAVRREARRRAGGRDLRAGAVEGAGPRRVPGPEPVRGVRRRGGVEHDRARRQRPRRAHRAGRQARGRRARRRAPRRCPTRCRSRRARPTRRCRTGGARTGGSARPRAR